MSLSFDYKISFPNFLDYLTELCFENCLLKALTPVAKEYLRVGFPSSLFLSFALKGPNAALVPGPDVNTQCLLLGWQTGIPKLQRNKWISSKLL